MEREKAAAKPKTLHWWLLWVGSPVAIFAILGGGLLYIAQGEVKPVIAKVDAEVKRLDATDAAPVKSSSRPNAVHVERDAGDVGRLFAAQEYDGFRYLVGF